MSGQGATKNVVDVETRKIEIVHQDSDDKIEGYCDLKHSCLNLQCNFITSDTKYKGFQHKLWKKMIV